MSRAYVRATWVRVISPLWWRKQPTSKLRMRKLERRRVHLVHCRLTQSLILLAEMDRQGVNVLFAHDGRTKVKRRMLERCIDHDRSFMSVSEARRREGFNPRPDWQPRLQRPKPTLEGEHRIRRGYVRVDS